MSEYKKQHYLPVAYLRHFAENQTDASRKTYIWRFDGKSSARVAVGEQCFENYFYAKSERSKIEKMFCEGEGVYAELIRKIQTDVDSTKREFFALILLMFDFHLRSSRYENKTSGEGIRAYTLRVAGWKRLLLNRTEDSPDPTDDEVMEHLQKHWRVRVLKGQPDSIFITSDNPSIWLTTTRPTRLHLVILPITPHQVAIAFDKRFHRMKGSEVTGEDQAQINRLQARTCQRFMFSSRRLDAESEEWLRKELRQRSRRRPVTEENMWSASFMGMFENRFSFLTEPPISL